MLAPWCGKGDLLHLLGFWGDKEGLGALKWTEEGCMFERIVRVLLKRAGGCNCSCECACLLRRPSQVERSL